VSIATSLVNAQEAIKADHEGNYRKALPLYKDAVLKLDAHVLACVGDEDREKLIEIVRPVFQSLLLGLRKIRFFSSFLF